MSEIMLATAFLRALGISTQHVQLATITIEATPHSEKCSISLRVDTESQNMAAFRLEQYELVRKTNKPDGVPMATATKKTARKPRQKKKRIWPVYPDFIRGDNA